MIRRALAALAAALIGDDTHPEYSPLDRLAGLTD
jgi:hypothetical protein